MSLTFNCTKFGRRVSSGWYAASAEYYWTIKAARIYRPTTTARAPA